MRTLTLAALLLVAGTAMAQGSGYMTYRCERGLVVTDGSTAELIQACGKPDRVVTLENTLGAAVGERWEYYRGKETVSFTISKGKVQRIDLAG